MTEHIEREALMAYAHEQPSGFISDISIQFFTAADVAPVVHGEWLGTEVAYAWKCSACGGIMSLRANYCCYCGAKMDGKDDKDGK